MNKEMKISYPTLSIRINTDGFCFCTYFPQQPDSVKYSYYECDKHTSLNANFETAWETSGVSEQEYAKIQIILTTTDFTTIPSELYQKEEYETIYKSCFPSSKNDIKILANKLNLQNITILFAVNNELHERLCQIGEVSYYSSASIILGFLIRHPHDSKKYIIANLQNDQSLFIAMKEKTPVLTNGLCNSDIDNQLYYLLCIWNELEMSQTEDTLLICGDNFADKFEIAAKKFIRNVKHINTRELFPSNLLNKIEKIPFDLQTLLLCE